MNSRVFFASPSNSQLLIVLKLHSEKKPVGAPLYTKSHSLNVQFSNRLLSIIMCSLVYVLLFMTSILSKNLSMSDVKTIKSLYLSKAKNLLTNIDNADVTGHAATTGNLREKAIIESLSDVIPYEFELKSGFVIDASGKKSPQLDIIGYKKGDLPTILLDDHTVFLPFELFKFGIEVKSTLRLEDFEQIKSQVNSLRNMRHSAFLRESDINDYRMNVEFFFEPFPIFLVAVDSSVASDTIISKLIEIKGLEAIYIIKKGVFERDKLAYKGDSDIDRIIRFWSHLFMHSQNISQLNRFSNFNMKKIIDGLIKEHGFDLSNPYELVRVFNEISKQSIIPYLYPSVQNLEDEK